MSKGTDKGQAQGLAALEGEEVDVLAPGEIVALARAEGAIPRDVWIRAQALNAALEIRKPGTTSGILIEGAKELEAYIRGPMLQEALDS